MQIWLLRHAEAETAAASGHDQDRRLSPAGRTSCHDLQAWVRDHAGPWPGTILVSPARRALETAETALDRLNLPAIEVESSIWNASAGDLLALIERSETRPQPLLLVGHNPGLENLVVWLCDGIPLPGMKAGTLVIIKADQPLRPGCGRIEHFVQPSDST